MDRSRNRADRAEHRSAHEAAATDAHFSLGIHVTHQRVWDLPTLLTETNGALQRSGSRCAMATMRLVRSALEPELTPEQGQALGMAAATRLARSLRPGDGLAETAPGCFSLLVTDLGEPLSAWRVAERLVGRLQEPFRIADKEVSAQVEVAVVISAAGTESAEELLAATDEALEGHGASGHSDLAVLGSTIG